MLHDVHRLATRYHWSEDQILRLALPRRAAYLALLSADDDRHLFDALEDG
ncbi:MAG: hypothetical protein U0441_17605 [Polyangiaceae bacterium]